MSNPKIGIVGNGIMGVGISSICSYYGYDTILFARSEEKASISMNSIQRNIKRLTRKHGDTHRKGTITAVCDFEDFSAIEIAIECVTEDFNLKQKVYEKLSPFLNKTALLASNTSSISINKLAKTTLLPDRFIGLHFMNPATIIPLTELIVGEETSEYTIQIAEDFLNNLRRITVRAADTPGFIVNRLLITMINEAANLVGDNIGCIEDIDNCMKVGANHPLGPLALADLIGLDTCLAIMVTIHKETGDDKYMPSPTLRSYCDDGKLGCKSKQGFHSY